MLGGALAPLASGRSHCAHSYPAYTKRVALDTATGLGQMLRQPLPLFEVEQAASVSITILIMIGAVDAIRFWLRRAMMR